MTFGKSVSPHRLFTVFKYAVYALLTINVYFFFQEEFLATQHTFSQGLVLGEIISGFAATIDTSAWLLLLLLFELETSVISDQVLRQPKVKYGFMLARTLAYGFILYAFYGYLMKTFFTYDISLFLVDDICALVGQGFSTIVTLDEYPLMDLQSCAALQGEALMKLNDQKIIGTAAEWLAIQRLAWVDTINSITWIAVVLMLEVDVWLQIQGKFGGYFVSVSKFVKGTLYSILFVAAAYWGVMGDFLDFWDAFIWLVAFFFIEMNLFQWQEETAAWRASA